jgi:hypothetical protein
MSRQNLYLLNLEQFQELSITVTYQRISYTPHQYNQLQVHYGIFRNVTDENVFRISIIFTCAL